MMRNYSATEDKTLLMMRMMIIKVSLQKLDFDSSCWSIKTEWLLKETPTRSQFDWRDWRRTSDVSSARNQSIDEDKEEKNLINGVFNCF